jgi:hypothetical protein
VTVQVQNCCTGVLDELAGNEAMKGLYINQTGDVVSHVDQLHNIDSHHGLRYNMLPMNEWINTAVDAGLHPAVAVLIQEMDTASRPNYPKLLKGKG